MLISVFVMCWRVLSRQFIVWVKGINGIIGGIDGGGGWYLGVWDGGMRDLICRMVWWVKVMLIREGIFLVGSDWLKDWAVERNICLCCNVVFLKKTRGIYVNGCLIIG